MNAIKDKLALVTGGASGIGRLVALGLAERGARVVAWDIDEGALEKISHEAAKLKLPIAAMRCDVSDRAEVYRQAAKVRELFGRVDILVNNAGIVSGKKLLETPDEKIERTMAVNVLAQFWTLKAFLPAMIEKGEGHVVTVASAAGLIGVTGLADYSASKFASVGLDEALRMELRKQRSRVRTTIVCPFFIDTGLFAGVKTRFPLLLPILKPEAAALKIVGAIARGKKRVVMPPFVYSVYLLRLLPVGALDAVADFFGISSSMDDFKGRTHE
jgi:all-trans-retinol dehydrogenase (NAD+)